jgi:hypothetical protein
LKEKEEWIPILKKIIGQDQQDRYDNAGFGRKAPRRRRKKFLIILSKNKNNKNRIHSTDIHLFEVSHEVSGVSKLQMLTDLIAAESLHQEVQHGKSVCSH